MSDEIDTLRANFDTALSTLREANADFLNHLATTLGDGRFRAAAAMLRGAKPGRPAIDDTKALELAESLIKTGVSPSVHKACTRAAKMLGTSLQVETTRDRLRKKLRTKLFKSQA